MLKFKEKLNLEKNDRIILYRGADEGGDFIAYLRCDKNQYIRVAEDSEHGLGGNLNEYGQLLYLDYIAEPNAKAEEFIQQYLSTNN